MPVYEEKLISPLVIRFTQEHIRTTFQDGRPLEKTIARITTESIDDGDCDVILRFPFPQIEIVRLDSPSLDGDHWFTLDNRRLYCLQRVAAAHWPLKVSVVVDVMYHVDPRIIKRKCDTTSSGCSVTISPSSKIRSNHRWDWRSVRHVRTECASTKDTLQVVLEDDARNRVDALRDVPPRPSLLQLHSLANVSQTRDDMLTVMHSARSNRTPSTSASSNASDGDCNEQQTHIFGKTTRSGKTSTAVDRARIGTSDCRPENPDDLASSVIQDLLQQLAEKGNEGYVWIPHWKRRYFKHFGSIRQFLEERPHIFRIHPGQRKGFKVETVSNVAASK